VIAEAATRERNAAGLREQLATWVEFLREQKPDSDLHYLGDMDMVLREGRPYESVKWTTWRGTGYRRGPERRCFSNAFDLALQHYPELDYVEGFATTGLIGVHHAWCATPDGRVVDPTWREVTREDRPVDSWAYLGIPLDLDWVSGRLFRQDTYGIFGENGADLWKAPLPEEARA